MNVGGRAGALLWGLVLVAGAGCGEASFRPPHVLIVSLDTLRADDLAAYGYHRETAPSLTALAEQGVVYEQCYAPCSSTTPSHATLFTGRMPGQHGAFNFRTQLPESELTLSDLLGEAGWSTFAVASSVRFHLGSGFPQGFDEYVLHDRLDKNERSEAVTSTALDLIDRAVADGDGRPFFGFLHYFGPHEPYAPPEPFRSKWHPGLPSPTPEASSRYIQRHSQPGQDVPPETLEYLRALYDAEILYLDTQIRRLLDGLAERGLDRDTLLIVTSDHGEGFKENGRLSHSFVLNEELLQVPLILRWPGVIPVGERRTGPVGLIDIAPTVLELVRLPIPEGVYGVSLVEELIHGRAPRRRPPVLAQGGDLWAVTADLPSGRFKLMGRLNGERSLHRLDGAEWGGPDVIDEYPRERELLEALAASIGAFGKTSEDGDVEISEEMRQRIAELGYLHEVR